MKNPAKPGDFGTNGTRDVVGSSMSETTKRALNADLIDLSIPWCKRIDRTHLIAAPVANTPPRPSRLAAEGGVGNFTPTRSGNVGTASEAQTSRAVEECGCDRCQSSRPGFPGPSKPGWRYACEQCGNKRCPHHEWHGFECTSSNEPEQVGIEAKPDEATNSLPENGTACTGRKTAFLTVTFVALNVASLVMLVVSLGMLFGFLVWAVSVLGGCLFAEFWIVRPSAARRHASGGEGV